MSDHTALIEFYRSYGDSSFATDMPAYAEICRRIGDHPELVELIAAHETDAQQPNLLFAAVHDLLLGGLNHSLTEVYGGTSDKAPTPLFADLVLANRNAIDDRLTTKRTQTNEVGRCAVLALMLSDAQRRSGQPLAWVDLGASAGLNLNLDQYAVNYDLGAGAAGTTSTTGPAASSVQLHCAVRTGKPPIATEHADIVWRFGIDRAPIEVTDPDQARWLKACLWPSQHDRHDRLGAAIALARENPHPVLRADAADGIAAALEAAPLDAALVVTTTWVWYYLPAATRDAVLATLRASGRRVWWYSLEGRGVVDQLGQGPAVDVSASQMGLVEFAGPTERAHLFGHAHPHGTWLDWEPVQISTPRR